MKSASTVVELKPLPINAESWCVRMHGGDLSDAERRAFQSWLQASPDNRAEYELCELTFAVSANLADTPRLRATFPATLPLAPSDGERVTARVFSSRTRKITIAAAASVMLAVSAMFLLMTDNRYVTDTGEQKIISLADGSTVELNTASVINVELGKTERRVTLRQGEAFFNIAPDSHRPFIVNTATGQIRVLGTKFNVRVEGRASSVTVLHGHVQVMPSREQNADTVSASAPVDLFPGESAQLVAQRPIAKITVSDTNRLTSWRERKIYFEREALAKVIAEVNRYSEVKFEIPDAVVAGLKLSGVFRIGDTDSVAYALRESYNLQTERDGKRILVKKSLHNTVGYRPQSAY